MLMVLRAALLLGLLVLPAVAMADPVTIIASVMIYAGSGWVVYAGYALLVGSAVYGAANTRRKARREQAAARAKYNASLADRTVTLLQASPALRSVYGRCRVGGDIVADLTTDKFYMNGYAYGAVLTKKDSLRHLVIAVAAHEVEDIEDVYIGGVPIGETAGGWATGGPVNDPWANRDKFLQTRYNRTYFSNGMATFGVTGDDCVLYEITSIEDDAGIQQPITSIVVEKDTPLYEVSGGPLVGFFTIHFKEYKFNYKTGQNRTYFSNGIANIGLSQSTSSPWVLHEITAIKDDHNNSYQIDDVVITKNAQDGTNSYEILWANTTGFFTVYYKDYYLKSSVRWSKHLGAANQFVDYYLLGVDTTQTIWTSNHKLSGIAYVVVTFDVEDKRFSNGPGQLDFLVKGKKLLDPRTRGTQWSANPALIIYDYLRSPLGYGCADINIDTQSVINAANVCDLLTEFDAAAGGTELLPRYQAHGLVTTDQSKEVVLEDLCNSMAGTATYGAQWRLMAGIWDAPVMALTDDDLAGPVQITQAGVGIDDAINGMRGTYIPEGMSAQTDAAAYSDAAYVVEDGVELWGDTTFAWTDSQARCKNLQRILVNVSRHGLVIQYPAKMRAWPLQVGDRVKVTNAEFDWNKKTFRVTDWVFGLQNAVMLTLQEDELSIWGAEYVGQVQLSKRLVFQ